MCKAGQSFLFDIQQEKAHLWIVVTDPDAEGFFLVTHVTSLKGSGDRTVILHGKDHPFIRWSSCIAYSQSDLMSCERLHELVEQGSARMQPEFSNEVLRLILDGFTASSFTKKRLIDYARLRKNRPA
jgi:hypothetical protein